MRTRTDAHSPTDDRGVEIAWRSDGRTRDSRTIATRRTNAVLYLLAGERLEGLLKADAWSIPPTGRWRADLIDGYRIARIGADSPSTARPRRDSRRW